jgi:hypothetical protein
MDQAGGHDVGVRGKEAAAPAATESRLSRHKASNTPQRALANQPWKEYTAEGGRKYWYNTETKQSSWEMPEVYKAALGAKTPTIPTG